MEKYMYRLMWSWERSTRLVDAVIDQVGRLMEMEGMDSSALRRYGCPSDHKFDLKCTENLNVLSCESVCPVCEQGNGAKATEARRWWRVHHGHTYQELHSTSIPHTKTVL